jgi:hypothetical protein
VVQKACCGAKCSSAKIVALVLGFVVFWPIGLIVLLFILSGDDIANTFNRAKILVSGLGSSQSYGSSGNAAFDQYRDETLRRLEEEQQGFGDFMERLKRARDQEEFERFMAERRNQKASA